jgi:hypothetical protein
MHAQFDRSFGAGLLFQFRERQCPASGAMPAIAANVREAAVGGGQSALNGRNGFYLDHEFRLHETADDQWDFGRIGLPAEQFWKQVLA